MLKISNNFKAALRSGRVQFGLWQALASPYTAEVCALAGFDWLLFDGEHGPNSVPLILAQLQAIEGYNVNAVARIPTADPTIIKQYLDIGVTSLLVPFVESAEEATKIVMASQYPPMGSRGVAGGIVRASRWGRVDEYLRSANDQICILVQIESRKGLENVSAIANVQGVDGIFIGPSDLAASLGHIGQPDHPEVVRAIDEAIVAISGAGKGAGILAFDSNLVQRYIAKGCTYIAVGTDVSVLVRGVDALAARYRTIAETKLPQANGY